MRLGKTLESKEGAAPNGAAKNGEVGFASSVPAGRSVIAENKKASATAS
jgi:hypothetical protein